MEQWILMTKRADFNGIASRFHISPVMARLLRNRDVISDEEIHSYLYGSLGDLPSSSLLKDVEKAADIILQKTREGKMIRIISDYDVDGISSNYILWKGLRRCGARVDYRIPDRVEDGYGINEHLISQAKEDGIDTILTCDNGIAALEQIKYAKASGMTVVVTDHHDIPYEMEGEKIIYQIPDADAVVNPKQEDSAYPNREICGAVVCYKLMEVIYRKAGIPSQEIQEFLPLAALATVCDVMPLRGENRILVKEGIRRMYDTHILGLRALLEVTGTLGKKITSHTLGFILGPCINASGRLKTAQDAMELLTCQTREEALSKAGELVELNNTRKEMTRMGVEEAISYLEESDHYRDKVLVVYLPDCHESIAGIIAGRIKEHYHKPVFVLTRSKGGIKGSGRSIEAYHMFQEMTKVKDLFVKYGGHPMAAGLSMEEDRIEELRGRLNENTSLEDKDFVEKVNIDVAVPFSYLSEEFIGELSLLEPFGKGNEKPLFAQKDLRVSSLRVMGTSGRCTKLYVYDRSGYGMEVLYFGESDEFLKEMEEKYGRGEINRLKKGLPTNVQMHITYYPQINEWRGNKTIQAVIQNYRFC